MHNRTVYFRFDKSVGWRVSHVSEPLSGKFNGVFRRAMFDRDEIAVTGNFKCIPRVGRFCKRPDQIVKVKEFWK